MLSRNFLECVSTLGFTSFPKGTFKVDSTCNSSSFFVTNPADCLGHGEDAAIVTVNASAETPMASIKCQRFSAPTGTKFWFYCLDKSEKPAGRDPKELSDEMPDFFSEQTEVIFAIFLQN